MLMVHEIFLSIQGESTSSGLPTTFIRLFGCPVGCSFCDQPQNIEDMRYMSVAEVMDKLKELKCNRVCLTGGEPMIQEDAYLLIDELVYEGYIVSVETSGCVPLEPMNFVRTKFKYIMDVKCPSSGISHKNIDSNLDKLYFKDEVKFVIANIEDFDFALDYINKYKLTSRQLTVLLSPMFKKDGTSDVAQSLAKWILDNKLWDVRIQVQLHKFLNVL